MPTGVSTIISLLIRWLRSELLLVLDEGVDLVVAQLVRAVYLQVVPYAVRLELWVNYHGLLHIPYWILVHVLWRQVQLLGWLVLRLFLHLL